MPVSCVHIEGQDKKPKVVQISTSPHTQNFTGNISIFDREPLVFVAEGRRFTPAVGNLIGPVPRSATKACWGYCGNNNIYGDRIFFNVVW